MANIILENFPLGSHWPTFDPFLFCAHHQDDYPKGNSELGPAASLVDHNIGQDFDHSDGWSMYHGSKVPGFPQHPHRGFETISYLLEGLMDHADSLGATARFGAGDVQWMTTGNGIQHSEMFPLVNQHEPNPLKLFQIWLNLPAADKMVDPYFTMFWNEKIPRLRTTDAEGNKVVVVVIAGQLNDVTPPLPPPNSWAANEDADLAIWSIELDPKASWTLPPAKPGTTRTLYAFGDHGVELSRDTKAPAEASQNLAARHGARIEAAQPVRLQAGADGSKLVVLQGRAIAEPVAQYGPFVMNTEAQIHQAFADYRETEFGGWPWPDPAPDHGRDKKRFAVHANGASEEAPSQVMSAELIQTSKKFLPTLWHRPEPVEGPNPTHE